MSAILFGLGCMFVYSVAAVIVSLPGLLLNAIFGSTFDLSIVFSTEFVAGSLLEQIPLVGDLLSGLFPMVKGVSSIASPAVLIDDIFITLLFASLFNIMDIARRWLGGALGLEKGRSFFKYLFGAVGVSFFSIAAFFTANMIFKVLQRLPFIASAQYWMKLGLLVLFIAVCLLITFKTSKRSFLATAFSIVRSVALAAAAYCMLAFVRLTYQGGGVLCAALSVVFMALLAFLAFVRSKEG